MNKLPIIIISIGISLFSSCGSDNNKDQKPNNIISVGDTAGLAAFKEAKNEQLRLADKAKIDSLQSIVDSSKKKEALVKEFSSEGNTNHHSPVKKHGSRNSIATKRSSAAYGSGSNRSYSSAAPSKKKGMSGKTKGALIGAGSGAVVGALVAKKNRGLGAVVGAAVGGGTGYIIGNKSDKKKGK